ncbi:hypothetical protein M0805_004690 [Coniferiporia weirii]|nr:hypothetical protein M0805_004690 [Coniferiporia weirii]
MADAGLSADASVDGGICIVCVTAIWSFCLFKPYGAGSATSTPCGGSRGCRGSCLQSGFDEDSFEKAERKAREKREKREQTEKADSKPAAEPDLGNDADPGSTGAPHRVGDSDKLENGTADTQPIAVQPGPEPGMHVAPAT